MLGRSEHREALAVSKLLRDEGLRGSHGDRLHNYQIDTLAERIVKAVREAPTNPSARIRYELYDTSLRLHQLGPREREAIGTLGWILERDLTITNITTYTNHFHHRVVKIEGHGTAPSDHRRPQFEACIVNGQINPSETVWFVGART